MEKKLSSIAAKYQQNEYKYYTSIDVGYNTYIAAVVKNIETKAEFNVKIKSKRYHRSTKSNIRRKRFVTLVGDLDRQARAHRESFAVMPTPTGPDFMFYVQHCLQFWARNVEAYTREEYAAMAFDKYLNCQKRMDGIVSLLSNREATLFGIGGADFNPNSPIKGHVRCPGIRKFVEAVKKHPANDHFFIDEFNTSQHCGLCVSKFDRSTKADRFKRCVHCANTAFVIPKAPTIRTEMPARQIQRIRKAVNPGHQLENVPRVKYAKYKIGNAATPTTWQRDISACRLIGYKGNFNYSQFHFTVSNFTVSTFYIGINGLLGSIDDIDRRLLRPTGNNSAYDDCSDYEDGYLRPRRIIWI